MLCRCALAPPVRFRPRRQRARPNPLENLRRSADIPLRTSVPPLFSARRHPGRAGRGDGEAARIAAAAHLANRGGRVMTARWVRWAVALAGMAAGSSGASAQGVAPPAAAEPAGKLPVLAMEAPPAVKAPAEFIPALP